MNKSFLSQIITIAILGICGVSHSATGLYGVFEKSFNHSDSYSNPYTEVVATATLTAPDTSIHTIPLFWDGSTVWKLRFSPDQIGTELAMTVYQNGTRLDVMNGKVSYKRTFDGKSVDVSAGHFSIASEDVDLKVWKTKRHAKHPDALQVATELFSDDFKDDTSKANWQMFGGLQTSFKDGLRITVPEKKESDWVGVTCLTRKKFNLDNPMRVTASVTWNGSDKNRLVLAIYFIDRISKFNSHGGPERYVRFQTYGKPSEAKLQLTRTIPNKNKIEFDAPSPFKPGVQVPVTIVIDSTMIYIKLDQEVLYYGVHSMIGLENVYVGVSASGKFDVAGEAVFTNLKIEEME